MAENEQRNPRPRLLLHLGWDPATGSVLQRLFEDRSSHLLDAGVLYPVTGRSPDFPLRHDAVPAALLAGSGSPAAGRTADDLVAALQAEMRGAGAHSVLLSSPMFASLDEDAVERFAMAFRDFEIRPMAVVGNFTDWLSSRYGERVLTQPVVSYPSAEAFAGRMYGRLAAWAASAPDGFVDVLDAAGAPPDDVVHDVVTVLHLAEAVPERLSAARSADPHLPAVVAIVREFRARGVAEDDLAPLAAQLATVPFTEHLTSVADDDAAVLDQRYVEFHERLRGAPFARWVHQPSPPPERVDRTHLNGAAAAVFAIGRAISP